MTKASPPLREHLARSLCRFSGSDCFAGRLCRNRAACDGWPAWLPEADEALRAIRERAVIVPGRKP